MRIVETVFTLPDSSDPSGGLLAFCSVTFEGELGRCVVRDLKIIKGRTDVFLAMPSRKLQFRCGECKGKNCLAAQYCNWCGHRVYAPKTDGNWQSSKDHADIFHPIDPYSRKALTAEVLRRFDEYQNQLPRTD